MAGYPGTYFCHFTISTSYIIECTAYHLLRSESMSVFACCTTITGGALNSLIRKMLLVMLLLLRMLLASVPVDEKAQLLKH